MRHLQNLQWLACIGLLAAFAPAGDASAQGCDLQQRLPAGLTSNCTVRIDGMDRAFDVMVGAQIGRDAPIVFDAHGLGSNKQQQRAASGLSRLATENKAVVIFGQGIQNSWNGQTCCGAALNQRLDDVGFARAAVEAVRRSLGISEDATTAFSGISNGMSFANRVACTAGADFDLVAGVSFQLVRNLQPVCQGTAPRTIYSEFHATNDQVVPFPGGLLTTGPADEVPQQLAAIRGCDATPQTTRLNSNTSCQTFSGCAGGGFVQMCTVQGGNHVLYPFVGEGDEQPDFDAAFETLLEQATELKRGGAAPAR